MTWLVSESSLSLPHKSLFTTTNILQSFFPSLQTILCFSHDAPGVHFNRLFQSYRGAHSHFHLEALRNSLIAEISKFGCHPRNGRCIVYNVDSTLRSQYNAWNASTAMVIANLVLSRAEPLERVWESLLLLATTSIHAQGRLRSVVGSLNYDFGLV